MRLARVVDAPRRRILAQDALALERGVQLRRGAKPSRPARIAASNSSLHGSRPWRWCASSSMRSTPGTPTERPPTAASRNASGLLLIQETIGPSPRPARSRGRRSCAASSRSRDQCSRNAPPPMPEDSGSTRPSTICTAIAASTAEPPRFSTAVAGLRRERMRRRDHEALRGSGACAGRSAENKKGGRSRPSHARIAGTITPSTARPAARRC